VSYAVRFTPAAARDLQRLFDFLAQRDAKAARRARSAIAKGINFLRDFPFSCRKASPEHPLLRELIISFGANGYVALFEIEDRETVTVLAVRHQREEDFF
jgi:plasmid stabilization system protein ParE